MNNKAIFSGIILLLSAWGLHSCGQFETDELKPEAEYYGGCYLTAVNDAAATALVEEQDKAKWFEEGTPYRLLAFTKAYYEASADDSQTLAEHLRFNTVAWEGSTPDNLRFINVAGKPDKMFGFSALEGETGGDNGFVSLDFYGFTYGKNVDNRTDDYIAPDDPAAPLTQLKYTETVSADGTLNDLMRGQLLNRNISNAGVDAEANTQSILPFRHCFSFVRFMVAQEEKTDANGAPAPVFEDIRIEKVELLNTYLQGAVYLQDGRVELMGDRTSRQLRFRDTFDRSVKTHQVDMGEMIVFPSDGNALKNEGMGDGYTLGLSITVSSSDKKAIEQFLLNANPENPGTVTGSDTDGWTGTIVRENIINNYTNTSLYLKQNTAYTLVISFQTNAVRIITVIPQVEEWLNGEGSDLDPWQEQALGQPQMFDNIVWSDRNLGADHYDPVGDDGLDFEKTIGYFYQSGRNIPYYTFNYKLSSTPDFDTKNTQHIADAATKWQNTDFRFYPIVAPDILNMSGSNTWTMRNDTGTPQMVIPETKPTGKVYFDFMQGRNSENTGLSDEQDMHWELGQKNQPVSGAWIIPSSQDFLTIFPSTPHAGNITMRDGGDNSQPMNWGVGVDSPIRGTKTLRVTVPYYVPDMAEPAGETANYLKAWRLLKENENKDNHNDGGTTHIDLYAHGRPGDRTYLEPDGDPEDGFASVYVISGEEGSTVSLSSELLDQNDFRIQKWGTIYAIKRIYTSEAYRMRWRALIAKEGTYNPCIYIEICRYRCQATDHLNEDNYMSYDWDHPAARIYFPVCGLGDWTGEYINFGTECQYATSDAIVNGRTSALQIKITGDNASNAYIAVVKDIVNRNFAKQIRPIGGGV